MKLVVGQIVYIAWNYNRTRRNGIFPAQIEKIGRKWVTLSNGYRFDRSDVRMDLDGAGYSSPGRVYLSSEEYEAEKALGLAWMSLRRHVDRLYSPPSGITLEAIQQATALLGFETEKGGA